MIANDFHFAMPEAAPLVFIVLIFLVLFWVLFNYQQSFRKKFSLLDLVMKPRALIFLAKALCFCLVWILVCLALMQPFSNERYPEGEKIKKKTAPLKTGISGQFVRQRKAHDVIILIDTSASMSVSDARKGLTRLNFAKEIADEIISELNGENVALYAFTSEALELVPPTPDHLFARLILRNLSINEGGGSGTNIARALQDLRARYFEKPSEKLKTLILLSDGEDNRLEISGSKTRKQVTNEILKPIADAQSHRLRVFTIGLGTKQGKEIPNLIYEGKSVISSLNEELMKKLANQGHGEYIFANQFSSLEIAHKIIDQISQANPLSEEQTITRQLSSAEIKTNLVRDLYFQIPLGIAILLLAFTLFWPDILSQNRSSTHFFGWFSSFALLLLCWHATGEALVHRDPEKPLRLAAAYFESESYDLAEEAYQKMLAEEINPRERAIIIYNLGCTFFAEKKWEQAYTTFNTALLFDSHSPLLTYRAKSNIALTLIYALTPEHKSSIEPILSAIDTAQRAYCQLQQIEGSIKCSANANLMRMRLLAKRTLAKVLVISQDEKVTRSPLPEVLPQLLSGIEAALSHLEFLNAMDVQSDLDPSLKMRYRDLFIHEEKNWLPFWSALQQKLEINKNKEQNGIKSAELFLLAKKQFEQALQEMENNELARSQQNYSAAANLIKKLIEMLPPSQPFKENEKQEEKESSQTQEALQQRTQAKEPPISKEPGESSVEEVLQLLLQMEREDRLPSPAQPEQTKGLRPW